MMVIAGYVAIQGCVADSTVSPVLTSDLPGSTLETLPKPTISPTVKTTIAPIHTKEPDIKPPVEQSSGSPSVTPTPNVPLVKSTPTVVKPISTGDIKISPGPGDNESASTYFQWGRAYEDAGDYTAAIEEYDRAIAREPYDEDAWYHKALSYENLGMWDEAYQAYRFLLTINPGYSATSNGTGIQLNNSTVQHLPPVPPPDNGTPLIWIASGAAIAVLAGVGAALFILYHRKKFIRATDAGDIGITPRPVQSSQAPFPDLDLLVTQISPYYGGDYEVFKSLMRLCLEIAREGREGKPIGTAFILGDSDAVLERSRQLILNPVSGHSEKERMITSPDMRENIKELALVDGAFVIRESGVVEAAGRYISIDTSGVRLPKGFGTRHVSVAAITQETGAIGIVVSESGGVVRVFAQGKVIADMM